MIHKFWQAGAILFALGAFGYYVATPLRASIGTQHTTFAADTTTRHIDTGEEEEVFTYTIPAGALLNAGGVVAEVQGVVVQTSGETRTLMVCIIVEQGGVALKEWMYPASVTAVAPETTYRGAFTARMSWVQAANGARFLYAQAIGQSRIDATGGWGNADEVLPLTVTWNGVALDLSQPITVRVTGFWAPAAPDPATANLRIIGAWAWQR